MLINEESIVQKRNRIKKSWGGPLNGGGEP